MSRSRLAARFAAAAVLSLGFAASSALADGLLLSLSKGGNALHVYDAESFEPVGQYPVGVGPHEVITDASGRFAYAANYGNQRPGNTVTVIDLTGKKVVTTVDLGPLARPHGLAEHNGKIYFTSELARAVARIDVKTNTVDWVCGTGQGITHMVAVNARSGELWTADISAGTVTVINPSAPPPTSVAHVKVPGAPEGIAVSPDGAFVAVGDNEGGDVTIIDAKTKQIVGAIATGGMPIRVGFTPDGRRLLVTDPEAHVLRVYDFASREKVGEVEVGQVPIGFVVNRDDNTVLISAAGSGEVVEVGLDDLKVRRRVKTGPVPDGIALVTAQALTGRDPAAAAATPRDEANGPKPRLGVQLAPTQDADAVAVVEVIAGSLAERIGLEAGDVIYAVDGKQVTDPQEVVQLVFGAGAGQTLTFSIVRAGKEQTMSATLP